MTHIPGKRDGLAPALRLGRGFTLIELLAVLAIVSLLLTIAAPRFIGTLEAGAQKVQAQNLSTLRDAIDKFYADRNVYPTALEDLVKAGYLRSIPVDPVSGSASWRIQQPPGSSGAAGVYDVLPPQATPPDEGERPDAAQEPN